MALALVDSSSYAHLLGPPECVEGDQRYIEQHKRAQEHAQKFRAAVRKSRRVYSSCAHLIDSLVKQEDFDTSYDSDEEEDGEEPLALVPDDEDQQSCLDFKERLHAELDRAYDPWELAEKLESANRRKAVLRHRETRHRTVNVETKHEGMSYLDHHPDLSEKLASCTSEHEQLHLLRGFFFWLQHTCNSDAFKPWASPPAHNSDDCFEVDGLDGEINVRM